MAKKSTSANLSPAIQKVFLCATLIFILAQIGTEAYFAIRFNGSRAFSSNLWLLLYTVLFPLLLFTIALVLHPRRAIRIPIMFECAMLAVAGFLVYSSLSYLGAFIPDSIFNDGSQWSWFASQAIVFGVCGLIYVSVLIVLRKTKRW